MIRFSWKLVECVLDFIAIELVEYHDNFTAGRSY